MVGDFSFCWASVNWWQMFLFCIIPYGLLKRISAVPELRFLSPICQDKNVSCYQMPAAKQKKTVPNLAFNNFCPQYIFVTFLLSFSLSALTGLILLLSRLNFAQEVKQLKKQGDISLSSKSRRGENPFHTYCCMYVRALENSSFPYLASCVLPNINVLLLFFFSFRWAYLENLLPGKLVHSNLPSLWKCVITQFAFIDFFIVFLLRFDCINLRSQSQHFH